MRIKNTFIQGRMNKDVDERLLKNGQYRHAENLRVANSASGDAGAVENMLGNELLSSLSLVNAIVIGSYADTSNQKIYWFVTSDNDDMVLEYSHVSGNIETLLHSTKPEGTLNFNDSYLITGVVKLINGDSNKDLLLWTDDLNPPRMINVERSKSYSTDGFIDEDISLIKKPPRYAPSTELVEDGNLDDNNIEDMHISIMYRYKYLDGEYSALSSYTYYQFQPKEFELDYQTIKNNGMVNSKNAINITFSTGSKRVSGVELVFKEARSNTLYLIESFDKSDEGWGDDEDKTFLFKNDKRYAALPEDELYRDFDNVPRVAKAMELIGNRLIFGNYVEGYDLKDNLGDNVKIDFSTEIISQPSVNNVPFNIYSGIGNDLDFLNINVNGMDLTKGNVLSFTIEMYDATLTSATFPLTTFEFIFPRDYEDSQDLAEDPDFIYFVETIMTERFLQDKEGETPPAGMTESRRNYFRVEYARVSTNYISIQAPETFYDNGGTEVEGEWWYIELNMQVAITTRNVTRNLKTNRTYETGLKYMDKYGRASTVLTSKDSSVILSQNNLGDLNQLQMSIVNKPPYWADRYKFVVKQNRTDYETIYSSIFYPEGLYTWVRLEGDSKDKVKEGDTLIVKSDLGGLVNDLVKVDVLELGTKDRGFIDGNVDTLGNTITEEAGFYMKIKPTGLDLNLDGDTVFSYDRFKSSRDGKPTLILAGSNTQLKTLVGYYDNNTSMYVDYPIQGGSRIRIKFRNYESDGYNETYEKSFVAQANYSNFQTWWEAEVVNLGDQESNFTWNFYRRPEDNGLQLTVRGEESGAFFEKSRLSCQIDVSLSQGTLIFETEGTLSDSNIFYETEETFDIVDGYHNGNIQNQSELENTAIVKLGFFNCYTQGTGNESYRYKDAFNGNKLNIDFRPSATSIEEYRETRRYADITYSEAYNENNNANGINEFNLSKANYKEDIHKKYGYIQKLYARDTDLIVFQEDKVSKVLYAKDALLNADGTSNISSVEYVLGQQIMYNGEYGISRNPESFAFNGYNMYFTDAKRGAVLRLSNNGIEEISGNGMITFFRDAFKNNIDGKKLGAFDPHYDQYIVSFDNTTVSYDEKVKGWTSFHSYIPDNMIGMNNQFFSFKGGELYIHHSENVPCNQYYGEQFPTKVSLMMNESPSDIKRIQAMSLEGSHSWDTLLKAYVSSTNDFKQSTISGSEYEKKEGLWYGYTRRDENDSQDDSKSTYGVGEVSDIVGNTIFINGYNSSLSSGDTLMKGIDMSTVGIIDTIVRNNFTEITLSDTSSLSIGDFVLGRKDSRVEGGSMRGYVMNISLEINTDEKVELFAVNTEVFKSYM